VVPLQILDLQSKGQHTIAPNLKPVIEDGHADRTSGNRVVAMAEGVDQCLPQCRDREEWLVDTFQAAGLKATGDRQVAYQEGHGLIQQMKSMAIHLPVIQELRFVNSLEASKAELALGKIRKKTASKKDNSSVEKLFVTPQAKAIKDIRDVAFRGFGEASSLDTQAHGAEDLFLVQSINVVIFGWLVFPSVPVVGALH
jgi:hypothetical protein